ncbi:MAG: TetR/AcrR family transcriptional regulator [Myxococcales bacterium]
MARPQTITDEQILSAARSCFLRHGPAVAVSRIAEQLGVSHVALLHRCGSKEEILRRAFAVSAPDVIADYRNGPAQGGSAKELEQLLEATLSFLRALVPGLVVLRAAGTPLGERAKGAEAPTRTIRRELAGWLRRARADGLQVAQPEAWAELLLGTLEARCFNAYLGGEEFVEGSDRAFVRTLVRTLVSQSRTPPPRRRAGNVAGGKP